MKVSGALTPEVLTSTATLSRSLAVNPFLSFADASIQALITTLGPLLGISLPTVPGFIFVVSTIRHDVH